MKNFYLKEEVGACRAVSSFVNSAYLCALLIRSESSSPSLIPRLRLSPSPQSLNLFPDVIVQVGAAQSAWSSAAASPEPLGGSAALRRTDFPRLMQVRPRTQRTPVGGDRRRLDRPPHHRGSSLSTWLWAGQPQEEPLRGWVDGRCSVGLIIIDHHMDDMDLQAEGGLGGLESV